MERGSPSGQGRRTTAWPDWLPNTLIVHRLCSIGLRRPGRCRQRRQSWTAYSTNSARSGCSSLRMSTARRWTILASSRCLRAWPSWTRPFGCIRPARNQCRLRWRGTIEVRPDLVFGWPYETRVHDTNHTSQVCSNAIRSQNLTHHAGGMAPHFSGRVEEQLEDQTARRRTPGAQRSAIEYYRRFYGDTALSGAPHALACAAEFYGIDRLVFGTDMPSARAGGILRPQGDCRVEGWKSRRRSAG